ncbi:MAG: GntR family transcriptional regulator [Rhodospirillales bacterium]
MALRESELDEKRGIDRTAPRKGTDALTPVRSASVVDMVFSQLEGLFFANAFAPGERLNELDLAKRMDVSRSSLREAARKLEQRGWLVAKPNRGFFVRSFTEPELAEIYEARLCLESFGLRKAFATEDPALATRPRVAFKALEAAAKRGSDATFVDHILGFHRVIAALSGNGILLENFDTLAMDTRLMISLIGGVQANRQEFLRRNGRILAAIEAGDAEASLREVESYMVLGLEEVLAFLRDRQA